MLRAATAAVSSSWIPVSRSRLSFVRLSTARFSCTGPTGSSPCILNSKAAGKEKRCVSPLSLSPCGGKGATLRSGGGMRATALARQHHAFSLLLSSRSRPCACVARMQYNEAAGHRVPLPACAASSETADESLCPSCSRCIVLCSLRLVLFLI